MTKQTKDALKAAQLRVLAVQQEQRAAAHLRQAAKPIYAGQDVICADKAAECRAFAAQNRAQADLLDPQR